MKHFKTAYEEAGSPSARLFSAVMRANFNMGSTGQVDRWRRGEVKDVRKSSVKAAIGTLNIFNEILNKPKISQVRFGHLLDID